MAETPTYLGLLNGISLAESRAHDYFEAWIALTPSAAVKEVLQTVSCREGEHGMAFAKRINELGYQLRDKEDPRSDRAMEVASSNLSDIEKFRELRLDRIGDEILGYFDNVFSDHTIDVQTGMLLGRYIAEEHDTARLLRGCYEALLAGEGNQAAAVDERIETLTGQVEALCLAVDELRQIVCGQATPTNGQSGTAGNGHSETSPKRARR